MTIRQLIFLAAALFLFGLVLTGCNHVTRPDSPAVAAAKVSQAAQSRHNLWEELQKDKAAFTEDEWSQATGIHARTADLSARIMVRLATGLMPPPEEVDGWIILGTTLYDDAVGLMLAKHGELSFTTQSAWALEKARLAALLASARKYVENPDVLTYEELATLGLIFSEVVLTTAIGL